MVVRKTAEQIKEEILSYLKETPLSIEQLRIKLGSNWATTNNYLAELSKEGKVKEIISTDKAKIYQRIYGDTYFNLPITDEQRKKFHTLFFMIIEEYRKHKKVPTKTHIAKCAVHVIDNKDAGLEDLPIAWYLYGMMPLMAIDTNQDYSEEFPLKHKEKVKGIISEFYDKNRDKGSGQIQKEQHKKYNEEIYVLSDKIFKTLNKDKFDNKEILDSLNELFIVCPVDNEFPEIFDLTEKVLSIIEKLALIGVELKTYRKEVLLLFDSLWKLIAIYKLYKSITTGPYAMKKETVKRLYLGSPLEERKRILNESFSDLNSTYLANLAEFDVSKLKLSEEAKEINKIMGTWTGED